MAVPIRLMTDEELTAAENRYYAATHRLGKEASTPERRKLWRLLKSEAKRCKAERQRRIELRRPLSKPR